MRIELILSNVFYAIFYVSVFSEILMAIVCMITLI